MSRPAIILAILLGGALFVSVQGQQPTPAAPPASTGSLRELIPGHYVWSSNNPNRAAYNSGVIVTDEGVVVLDALESEAIARAQREAIAGVTKQPYALWFLLHITISTARATLPIRTS